MGFRFKHFGAFTENLCVFVARPCAHLMECFHISGNEEWKQVLEFIHSVNSYLTTF